MSLSLISGLVLLLFLFVSVVHSAEAREWYFTPVGGSRPTNGCSLESCTYTAPCSGLPETVCIAPGDYMRFANGIYPIGVVSDEAFQFHGIDSTEIHVNGADNGRFVSIFTQLQSRYANVRFMGVNGKKFIFRGSYLHVAGITIDGWGGGLSGSTADHHLVEIWAKKSTFNSLSLTSSAGSWPTKGMLLPYVRDEDSDLSTASLIFNALQIDQVNGDAVDVRGSKSVRIISSKVTTSARGLAACVAVGGGAGTLIVRGSTLSCRGAGVRGQSILSTAAGDNDPDAHVGIDVEKRYSCGNLEIANNVIVGGGVDAAGAFSATIAFNTIVEATLDAETPSNGGLLGARTRAGLRFTDAAAIAHCAGGSRYCVGSGAGYVDLALPAASLTISHNIVSVFGEHHAITVDKASRSIIESNVIHSKGGSPRIFFGILSGSSAAPSLTIANYSTFEGFSAAADVSSLVFNVEVGADDPMFDATRYGKYQLMPRSKAVDIAITATARSSLVPQRNYDIWYRERDALPDAGAYELPGYLKNGAANQASTVAAMAAAVATLFVLVM